MKVFIVLAFVLVSVAAQAYKKTGGYRVNGQYVYHYKSTMNVMIPGVVKHFTQLHLASKVKLHFLENEEVLLEISEINMKEIVKDSRWGPKVSEKLSPLTALLEKTMKIPIKFVHRNGLVQKIYSRKDDPQYSISIKKGILNLLHIDLLGQDEETGFKSLFKKLESTIFGKCPVTYNKNDHQAWNGKEWSKTGINITKVIDTMECTQKNDVFLNTMIQGPPQQIRNSSIDTSAVIQYNIIGTEYNFKIESVNATGVQLVYPYTRAEENAIVGMTNQHLMLVGEFGSTFATDNADMIKTLLNEEEMAMQLPEIEKPDFLVNWQRKDYENLAVMVHNWIATFVKKFSPEGKPDELVKTFTEKESETILTVINSLKVCTTEVMESIWNKCDEKTRSWYIYLLTACHTERCIKFMEAKIKSTSIPEAVIKEYLMSASLIGRSSKAHVENMLKICHIKKIASVPDLKIACYVATSNLLRTLCKVEETCQTSFQDKIISMLKILTTCKTSDRSCLVVEDIPTSILITIAENMIVPSNVNTRLALTLEQIVLREELQTEIRAKAILACRPLIISVPKRMRLILLRLFHDVALDVELRLVSFAVLMENPTPALIKIIAHSTVLEPSYQVRRYVYFFIHAVATVAPKIKYPGEIITACRIALKLIKPITSPGLIHDSYHKQILKMIETEELQAHLIHNHITTNKEIIPRFIQSKLNVGLFGKTVPVLDVELRLEGVQDFLEKIFGATGHVYKKKSVFDFIRKEKRSVKEIPEDKQMKIHSVVKMVDKLYYVNHLTTEGSMDLKNLFWKGSIFRAAALEKELERGKLFNMFKPIIGDDILFKMPTLLGIPLVYNLTAIILPRIQTEIKAEVQPHFFSASLLTKERELAQIDINHGVSGVTHVMGSVSFNLPIYDIGLKISTSMKMSAAVSGRAVYDMKNKRLTFKFNAPKTSKEVFGIKREVLHYIKTYPLPETSIPTTLTTLPALPAGIFFMNGKSYLREELIEMASKENLVKEVQRLVVENERCISISTDIKLCWQGYLPLKKGFSDLFLSTMELKLRLDVLENIADKVVIDMYLEEEAKERSSYALVLQTIKKDVGKTHLSAKAIVELLPHLRLRLDVTPADKDLFLFEKMCIEKTFMANAISAWVSMNKECSVKHLKMNLLFKREKLIEPLPKIVLRSSLATDELPPMWAELLTKGIQNVIMPILYYTSKQIQEDKAWKADVIPPGSSVLEAVVTPRNTMNVLIKADRKIFTFEEMLLPIAVKVLPMGSKHITIARKVSHLLYPFCSYRNPVVKTFDRVDFIYKVKDECPHILIRNCTPDILNFMVVVKKIQGRQRSHALKIVIGSDTFDIIPEVAIDTKPIFQVNGEANSYAEVHIKHDENKLPLYSVIWEKKHRNLVFMHHRLGLVVSLARGHIVKAHISPLYFGKICGICGNYDGETTDEFLTPDAIVEVKDVNEFGRSWIVPGNTCAKR